ncbi:MAG: helix-turn-helix transcriptional regulator [Flavobacteriales bacterium]|nr:helix-turn-helix transcriptional regulator [Flavobacteriales bacterium]
MASKKDKKAINEMYGARLYELRKQYNWKQTALALEVGICQSVISKTENGRHELGLHSAVCYARVFGCDIGEFLMEQHPRRQQLNYESRQQALGIPPPAGDAPPSA